MSGLNALAVAALVVGLVLLVGALLFMRSAARTATATRADLARLQTRLDSSDADSSDERRPPEQLLEGPGTVVAVVSASMPEPAPVPSRAEVAAAALQEPLVRVAVFAAGLRHALRPESRDRARAVVRREYQRRSKVRRRAARHAARTTVVFDEPASQERAS